MVLVGSYSRLAYNPQIMMISGFSVLIVYFASFIIFFYNLMLCLVPKKYDNKNQNQRQNERRNIRKEKR